MGLNLNDRDFPGTGIKNPAEKMRAMAIINAKDDLAGISKINFSLTAFLQKGHFTDICIVLEQWATEPIRNTPNKFIRFPEAGKQALIHRSNKLLDNLKQRRDLSPPNIRTIKTFMHNAIERKIMCLDSRNSYAQNA